MAPLLSMATPLLSTSPPRLASIRCSANSSGQSWSYRASFGNKRMPCGISRLRPASARRRMHLIEARTPATTRSRPTSTLSSLLAACQTRGLRYRHMSQTDLKAHGMQRYATKTIPPSPRFPLLSTPCARASMMLMLAAPPNCVARSRPRMRVHVGAAKCGGVSGMHSQ